MLLLITHLQFLLHNSGENLIFRLLTNLNNNNNVEY